MNKICLSQHMRLAVIFLTLVLGSACTEQPTIQPESTDVAPPELNDACLSMSELQFIEADASRRAVYQNIPYSGEACTNFSGGRKHTLTTYRDGYREGKWEVYYPNGLLHKRGYLKNGNDDGIYHEYFLSGQLQYEYHYLNGSKTGIWKSWYESGVQYTERHFDNDQLHGAVLVWDEQGALVQEYGYLEGVLVKSHRSGG